MYVVTRILLVRFFPFCKQPPPDLDVFLDPLNRKDNRRERDCTIGDQSDDKAKRKGEIDEKQNTAYLEIFRNLEEGRVRYN
jgi:hypothetical protein